MIYDYYDHKDIFDKNGEYLYTVSAHYKDRISYYDNDATIIEDLINSTCLSEMKDFGYIGKPICIHNISRKKSTILSYNNFCLLIFKNYISNRTHDKLSDYYYKG